MSYSKYSTGTVVLQDLVEECKSHMVSKSLGIKKEEFITDGKIHRYSADENSWKKDEWYIAFEGTSSRNNPYLICIYGSWSDGLKHVYKSWTDSGGFQLNLEERKEADAFFKHKQEEERRELQRAYDEAAEVASKLWKEASDRIPSEEYNRYTNLKGIIAIGAKFGKNPRGCPAIIIPLRNVKGEIRSLQFISVDDDGTVYKRFLSGGEIRGNFFVIGDLVDGEKFYAVEGYATGVSVYIGKERPTVVSFSAGNLSPVLESLKKAYPNSDITIAGDSDEIGRKKSNEAAKNYGCNVVFPVFFNISKRDLIEKGYNDFNDLLVVSSREEVARQLDNEIVVISEVEEQRNFADRLVEKSGFSIDFDLFKFPNILRCYVEELCAMGGAHPVMIVCSVLAMVSGFIKRKRFLSEGEYFQRLYPNIWVLNIADSGLFKTTANNKGGRLAFAKSKEINKRIKALRIELKKTQDDERKSEIEEEILRLSRSNALLPDKATGEGFIEYLSLGCGGTIFLSEFGAWLQNFEREYNKGFKSLMTSLFDAPKLCWSITKTDGETILEDPYISICAVSTPTWLRSRFNKADVESGFAARFLIFAPEYDEEVPPALPRKNRGMEALIEIEEDLKQIFGSMEEFSYVLSPEARVVFEKVHCEMLYKLSSKYGDQCKEILDPYIKRWSPYLLKLAIIMQVLEDSTSRSIGRKAIEAAVAVVSPAIASTIKLFATELGESDYQRNCRIVFEWIRDRIRRGEDATREKLLSSKKLAGGCRMYDSVIAMLVESGKIQSTMKSGTKSSEEYLLVDSDI